MLPVLCKLRKHAWTNSLCGNYELSFRRMYEESTGGSGNVCCIGFYRISFVWVCVVAVAQMPATKDPTSCTRVNVQDAGWTDLSSIPACTLSYEHTNSYRIPFWKNKMYFQFLSDIFLKIQTMFSIWCWGDSSFHVKMPSWCVMHLAKHVGLSLVLMIRGSRTIVCCILHQQLANLANHHILQAMFPTIMPWPMT